MTPVIHTTQHQNLLSQSRSHRHLQLSERLPVTYYFEYYLHRLWEPLTELSYKAVLGVTRGFTCKEALGLMIESLSIPPQLKKALGAEQGILNCSHSPRQLRRTEF